jgi:YVTN family beta-propeller protein
MKTGLFALSVLLFLLLAGLPATAGTLLVGNKAESTLSLIDPDSGKVVATLPTGEAPHEIAVSPDGKLALVSNYGPREKPGSTLTLVDVPGAKVVRTIDLGELRRPHGMVWISHRRALVTCEANQKLIEVDIPDAKVVRTFATGQEVSHMVAVTPDKSRAFVANIGSGSITAFDLKTGKHLGNIPTGAGAEGIDVTPDGKQVWVTNRAADSVSVVDTKSLKVIATIPVTAYPIRAKATPDGKTVLVSNAKSGDLARLGTANRQLAGRIELGVKGKAQDGRLFQDFGTSSVPVGILIEPSGKRAFVAHGNADQITVIDLHTGKPTGALTAGQEPDGMGWSPLAVQGR